ncbi:hypothetical protein G6F56_011840 [Rhizopus delemar]|nr:hypothetical protein G6F56_011840 [Rhizopus delemar]
MHQLLASKNIILLKEKEYDSLILSYIDVEDIELLRDSVSKEYRPQEKLNDDIHSKSVEITRGVNSESKRSELKKELVKLYDTASTDDERIIDIYLNW